MKNLFLVIILMLLVLGRLSVAAGDSIQGLRDDDFVASAIGKDIWFDNDTIDEHIKSKANSPELYLEFVFQLAEQVLQYKQKGTGFLAQRSLMADSLAIVVSRNFVENSTPQPIEVQKLLDQVDAVHLSVYIKSNFT